MKIKDLFSNPDFTLAQLNRMLEHMQTIPSDRFTNSLSDKPLTWWDTTIKLPDNDTIGNFITHCIILGENLVEPINERELDKYGNRYRLWLDRYLGATNEDHKYQGNKESIYYNRFIPFLFSATWGIYDDTLDLALKRLKIVIKGWEHFTTEYLIHPNDLRTPRNPNYLRSEEVYIDTFIALTSPNILDD